MRTRLFPLTALAALLLLSSCAPRVDRTPYPAQVDATRDAIQRRDFVDSFLQGRWCEAESLHADALDGAVRRDDFCEAAATARLAARMKAYLGLPAPSEEEAAAKYLRAGLNCPRYEAVPPRDAAYREFMDAGDWAGLTKALAREEDSLYASVYARKGARAAQAAGQISDALALTEAARAVDAAQGWVAFLRLDWQLRLELETDEGTKQAIRERIAILAERIEPCP